MIAALFLLPAMARAECVDPDSTLSVTDKTKARAEYARCLLDEHRMLQGAALGAVSTYTRDLDGRVRALELEVDKLKDQIEAMGLKVNDNPYPVK